MTKYQTKNPYVGIYNMSMIKQFQFRSKAFWGIATQLFWGGMMVMFYSAFYETGNGPSDFSQIQLASYIWLGQAFLAMRWPSLNNNIITMITKGDVAYEFVRPLDLYNNWFFSTFAQRVTETLLRFAPIIMISIFLPYGYGLSAPATWVALPLFVVSIVFGAVIANIIGMYSIILVMKTMSRRGVMSIVSVVVGFFGGSIIPIPFMPVVLQKIVNFLPFRYVVDLPFRIYTGNIPIIQGVIQICIQIVWIVMLTLIARYFLARAVRRVEIQGG